MKEEKENNPAKETKEGEKVGKGAKRRNRHEFKNKKWCPLLVHLDKKGAGTLKNDPGFFFFVTFL
jgi:hypothetical protein